MISSRPLREEAAPTVKPSPYEVIAAHGPAHQRPTR